jgi:hypothetical protein
MAYFPNGTSGMMYEEQYCSQCIHEGGEDGPGCPIMLLHLLFNYDQFKRGKIGQTVKTMLDTLIPETEDKLGAERCSMFVRREFSDAEIAEQRRLDEQAAKYEAAMAEARAA